MRYSQLIRTNWNFTTLFQVLKFKVKFFHKKLQFWSDFRNGPGEFSSPQIHSESSPREISNIKPPSHLNTPVLGETAESVHNLLGNRSKTHTLSSTAWGILELQSSPYKELLFVGYEYVCTVLYRSLMQSCDLRRGRLSTKLFTHHHHAKGTSQV